LILTTAGPREFSSSDPVAVQKRGQSRLDKGW